MKPMFKMKGLLLIIMVSLMLTLDANASQKFFPNPPVDIHQGFILNELPSGASDSESDTTGSTAINPVLTDTAFRNSILVLAATPRDKTGILVSYLLL